MEDVRRMHAGGRVDIRMPVRPRPIAVPSPAPIGMRSPVAQRLAMPRKHGSPDYVLLGAVVALLIFGLVMVYSASQYAVSGDPSYWFRKQAVWLFLGGGALLVTATIDYWHWKRFALPGMGVTIMLLVAVLMFGHTAYGAQRWLSLGIVSFQPSELTKLMLCIYISEWLLKRGERVRSFRYGLIPFGAVAGVVLALILMQNDMGTTLVVAAIALIVFFVAGATPTHLLLPLAVGLPSAIILAAGTPFRRARLDAFFNPLPPHCEPQTAYQVCQGIISLGSGGIFGVGLGNSVQKAGYLPNPFTDSIFAVIGNELGLMGCLFVLVLFALIAWRGLRAARRASDPFGALLACGITSWIVVEALINIGSVVDAIPFTGVPLPFVSFGGSSLVTSMAAIGILLNISRFAS